jgi:sugar phosphate isomerase/epimerase
VWINPGQLDLTYCTNIHAGESWDEVEASIARHALPLKKNLAPDVPFALGLRLSSIAATQLLQGDRLEVFKRFLEQNGLYVALINGFPYGSFHGDVVKAKVFAPDWREQARAQYTLNLAEILSRLIPQGMDGGISTMPLSYKPWINASASTVWPQIVANLVDVVEGLVTIRSRTGHLIHLDIEPEPNGLVENTTELIEFFEGPLQSIGVPLLAERLKIDEQQAHEHLRTHLQVCFDTCHMAIQFEDPLQALRRFAESGIRIGRVQISSALRVLLDGSAKSREQFTAQLASFVDRVYLHQVIERREDKTLVRYTDLDEALASFEDGSPREWRIHFHLPIFTERYGSLLSTHADNSSVLALVMNAEITRHLEIETYTWDVLPAPLKSDLLSSIEREFRWVLDELCVKQ